MEKRIIIAGGTGFIGSYLKTRFLELGFEVLVVSRDGGDVTWIHEDLVDALERASVVINLAGATINCRHTYQNKALILQSRIDTTNAIGQALLSCKRVPSLWVNASASAVYISSLSKEMTESETELADGFLADVVKQWEYTFFSYYLQDTRQIALRTSVVLGGDGGALETLMKLTQYGLGGIQGSGQQLISWIHVEDYFRILFFLIDQSSLSGVVNCSAPQPSSNKVFMQTLRNVLRVPIGIPAPSFGIKIGARLIGTEPELILDSCNMVPQKLIDSGFEFKYPELKNALEDLVF
jgi:uncharacterized protein (TIGR01777 family)